MICKVAIAQFSFEEAPLSPPRLWMMYVRTHTMHMGRALLLSQRWWSGWSVWERRTVDNARNSPPHNEHQAFWVGHSLEQVIRRQRNIDPNPKKKMLHPFFQASKLYPAGTLFLYRIFCCWKAKSLNPVPGKISADLTSLIVPRTIFKNCRP